MADDRYLFVDGGHLRRNFSDTLKAWSGEEPEFVIYEVSRRFSAAKCFYYDAIDDQRKPNEDQTTFENRLAALEERFDRIQRTPATHVRLGSVTGAQKNRRQKQVDILLAVEMMNHAVRGNMKHAVLLAGDQDFKPLVDSLVQMGLFVHVTGDKKHTSVELTRAADSYIPLTLREYHAWAPPSWRNKYPIPDFSGGNVQMPRYKVIKKGTIGGVAVDLSESPGEGFLLYYRHPEQFQYVRGVDSALLVRAFEMEFGPINWD